MPASRAGNPASDVASAGTLVTGAPSGERRRAVAAGARWTRGADDAERGAEPGPCGAAEPTGAVAAGGGGVVPAGDGVAGGTALRGVLGAPSGRAEAACGRAGAVARGAESRDAAVGGAGTEEIGAPRPVLGTSRVTLRWTDRPGAERAGVGLGGGFGLARDVADTGGKPEGVLPAEGGDFTG
ncbi:hypothetical protein ACTPOK_07845 [Streptomyces inhibens]|uniref:hypothetical protein n=1 Tax=Streptomyces inhibens TaxID=2293571 RepID=UPI00402AFF0A